MSQNLTEPEAESVLGTCIGLFDAPVREEHQLAFERSLPSHSGIFDYSRTGSQKKRKRSPEKSSKLPWGSLTSIAEPLAIPMHEGLAKHNSSVIRTSEQMALGIDHIFEKILLNLLPTDWFNLRLVDSRWYDFLTFYIERHGSYQITNQTKNGSTNSSLSQLTRFLKSPSPTQPRFPFAKVSINGFSLFHHCLQNFLDVYGKDISDLRFTLDEPQRSSIYENLLIHLRHLLLHQSPNLRVIDISFNFNQDNTTDQDPAFYPPLQINTPEYLQLTELVAKTESRNFNVRKARFGLVVLPEVVELIVQLCPSLLELDVDSDQYGLLIEPFNRIHLLRKPELNSGHSGYSDLVRIIEAIKERKEDKGPPLQFQAHGIFTDFIVDTKNPSPLEYRNKVQEFTTLTFESSWSTLREVSFADIGLFHRVTWPECLPNVRFLELDFHTDHDNTLVDRGFNFSKMLPNLRKIYFGFDIDNYASLHRFIRGCTFGQVISVRRVEICVILPSEMKSEDKNYCFGTNFLQLLSNLFPFAKLDFFHT